MPDYENFINLFTCRSLNIRSIPRHNNPANFFKIFAMISLMMYLRLWRLYALNQHLLKIYYSIYFGVTGEEADYYKREFSRRISHREKIQKEIEGFLYEIIPEKDSRFSVLINMILPSASSLDYKVHDLFFKVDLDKCQAYETKNIDMYYNFLYSGVTHPGLTDMLLEQKSVVEDSIYYTI
jgi:hypothetical protein